MSLPPDPKSDLQKAIQSCGAIIVAGTGVSIAASNNHPQASWTGLLKSGLELLTTKHVLMSAEDSAAHLQLLNGTPETVQFIATAQAITREMSPKMLCEWLTDTIGDIKATKRDLLDALEEIRQCGNMLATTNYDGLLLEGNADLSAVTWKDKAAFLGAHRHRETKRVLFLHGYWEAPESVILDGRSYEEITRDQSYRDDLNAVWRTSTWIYVGCGENGLSDPDIGLLLDLYGKRAREDGHWDFCLVRKSDRDRMQRYFNEKGHNICAVAFGENHGDLPGYLRSLLPAPVLPVASTVSSVATPVTPPIPKPPAFYAEPDYIGSHNFVGRDAELQALTDWAAPADTTNLLLFEAIGGNGKSILTWEWTKNHALAARPAGNQWAGRFWYSFYERGAIMADFCQRALAYMTARPLEHYAKKKTAELKDELLAQLHAWPWLLILDGLERVLVAYHRIDAAEVPDEEANTPTDKIAKRNPCDAIRDEDNDLLRALAAAAPSKILVSSRLTPRVLLNLSGQPITGVKRITLSGLRPPDAEKLLRSCGVREDSAGGITGDSAAIQGYLTANCDNHPLVIGILGGLIANYLPDRGNFDAWVADPRGGAALDLASLDIIQRRNHILRAALDALPPASKALLSTLALLTDSVDYETLKAFNPHLPPEPEEVVKPESPEKNSSWERRTEKEKARMQIHYKAALAQWEEYDQAVKAWGVSVEFSAAPKKLEATVTDLERRGLLQWDGRERNFNLHPVVRGVVSGGLAAVDLERHGLRVVDYFTMQSHRPFEEAETMKDVRGGLQVVRTLLKLGRFEQAGDAYRGNLANALESNLEAHAEILSLLQPFFPAGWGELPKNIHVLRGAHLAHDAGKALDCVSEPRASLSAYNSGLLGYVHNDYWRSAVFLLSSIATNLRGQNRLAQAHRVCVLALEVATLIQSGDEEAILFSRLGLFGDQIQLGQWAEAASTWRYLDPKSSDWKSAHGPVRAERLHAEFQYLQGNLLEEHLVAAESRAKAIRDRKSIRAMFQLRGGWRLGQREWALAAASFQEAVHLARECSLTNAASETGLALAKHHLRQSAGPQHPDELAESRHEAERLAQLRNPSHGLLAHLWLALGDPGQAEQHAIAAYRQAWADGEPYVHRYELTKATELLQRMDVPIPTLPPYDPAKDEPFPWGPEVCATIERLRAEKEAKKQEAD